MRNLLKVSTFVVATLVMISNASAQYSTPVRDVENPAHSPFLETVHLAIHSPTGGLGGVPLESVQPVVGVPGGKRLVIEFVSLYCETMSQDHIYYAAIGVTKNVRVGGGIGPNFSPVSIPYPLLVLGQGASSSGNATWVAAQTVRLYSEVSAGLPFPGYQEVTLTLRHKVVFPFDCDVSVSGYTVNAP